MRTIKAVKMAEQRMVEVTLDELRMLMNLNPWISLGQYDIKNHLSEKGVIGYVAGDIGALQMHEKDMKITDSSVHDCWFINKDFFDKNYKEIK
jgi:hypothetical protein